MASKAGGGIQSNGIDPGGFPLKTIVTNSTLASNTSVTGGAIHISGNAYANLTNTIVSNSSGSTNCYTDGVGGINDRGGNIDDGASCAFGGGSFSNTNPQLGSLGNNGGPTATKLPIAGSPAIDANACFTAPATDQRGIPRPQGALCDIGAIEREAMELSVFLDNFEGY